MTTKNKRLLEEAKKVSGINDEKDIITKALELFVERYKHIGKKNKSVYELSKHLAGSIEGPEDLGTNKKHSENFGIEGNRSFSFLETETDLYSDEDILRNRRNEKFSN